MIFTTFKRITRTGFVNFWRNGFLSFAAIVVITLSLCSFGALIFAGAFGRSLISEIKSTVTKSVRYPGLHQVQQRFLVVANLSSQRHSKAYAVRRKNGKIVSVFSWRYHEPIYNAITS